MIIFNILCVISIGVWLLLVLIAMISMLLDMYYDETERKSPYDFELITTVSMILGTISLVFFMISSALFGVFGVR